MKRPISLLLLTLLALTIAGPAPAVTPGDILVYQWDGSKWVQYQINAPITLADYGIGDAITAAAAAAAYQPLDADLTTWAGITPSANVQTLLGAANYAAIRTQLALTIGTDVQAYDADLTIYAGITPSANVQTLLGAANYAAIRTQLALTIGTDVQAYDADLTTWAGITPSANVQTLLGAANYAAIRTQLALTIGTDVQAYDADLTTWAGITPGPGVGTWLGTPSFSNLSSAVTGDTIAGSASTNTFTNKTFDASATGNVLKVKGYIYLTHPHLADGTNATIGTTATSITYGHATFSNSVDKASNYVEYFLQVPEDIDTSVALRARIKVLLGNSDTGSQRYVLSSVSVADSAVPGSATLANEINVDFAGDASGASGDVETSAWTTLTSWAGALTAGQTWRIRLARDGDTSDTSTENSSELGLVIEYGVTQ